MYCFKKSFNLFNNFGVFLADILGCNFIHRRICIVKLFLMKISKNKKKYNLLLQAHEKNIFIIDVFLKIL